MNLTKEKELQSIITFLEQADKTIEVLSPIVLPLLKKGSEAVCSKLVPVIKKNIEESTKWKTSITINKYNQYMKGGFTKEQAYELILSEIRNKSSFSPTSLATVNFAKK